MVPLVWDSVVRFMELGREGWLPGAVGREKWGLLNNGLKVVVEQNG